MAWLTFALLACSFIKNSQSIVKNEVQFDRIESLNSSYIEGVYNLTLLRISKFNRTAYVLNGEIETFVDVDENVELESSFYYNRFNNNQYNKSPIRLTRISITKAIEKFYDIIITDSLRSKTNLPLQKVNGELVPIKKVRINFIFT